MVHKEAEAAEVALTLGAALLDRVDQWRQSQPGTPSREQAVTRLVDRALKENPDDPAHPSTKVTPIVESDGAI